MSDTSVAQRPVIVVPGLFGSIIAAQKSPVLPYIEAWPSADPLQNRLLGMGDTGTALYPSKVTGIVGRVEVPLLPVGYDELLLALDRQFQTVVRAPYDWRYDLEDTVNGPDPVSQRPPLWQLIDAATQESPDGRVDVVCHSMGCLAMFVYLTTDLARFDNIRRIVFLAPPFFGTAESYKRLLWGLGPLTIKLSDDSRLHWKKLFTNMKGIYQIGPSGVLVTSDPDLQDSFLTIGSARQSFDQAYAFDSNDDIYKDSLINHQFLNSTGHWRLQLDSFLQPGSQQRSRFVERLNVGNRAYLAYATGEATDAALGIDYDPPVPRPMGTNLRETFADGDKNVLAWGLDGLGVNKTRVFPGITHLQLVKRTEPIQWTISALQAP